MTPMPEISDDAWAALASGGTAPRSLTRCASFVEAHALLALDPEALVVVSRDRHSMTPFKGTKWLWVLVPPPTLRAGRRKDSVDEDVGNWLTATAVVAWKALWLVREPDKVIELGTYDVANGDVTLFVWASSPEGARAAARRRIAVLKLGGKLG